MDWLRRLRKSSEYVALPQDSRWTPKRRRCRTRLFLCLLCAPLLLLFAVLAQGIPPAYDDVRAFERRLPQHHPDPAVRYLRFPNHLWGHGLNNVLQEALLTSYLAYAANVSFVFEDYTWSHIPLPWTLYGFALRPTRLPFNAIISGPTAGGPTSDAPPAVSAQFYESVCTPDTTALLDPTDAPTDADADRIVDWWRARIDAIDAKCIEIDALLFDRFLFGGPRVLAVLDALIASPILSRFAWSPLVRSALERNFALLQPPSIGDVDGTLDGLVAIHLRRGDYVRHCPNLAQWGADYMGVNQHPSLPDRFDPPEESEARLAYYITHCYPSTAQVVERLRAIREARPHLKRVYVLSNDWAWSLNEITGALEEDGWAEVSSTFDLRLDAEQYYVSMAVDMAIAERAEVFVGNGFSSLSSNVVMLRLAKGIDPSTVRFL